MNLTKYLNELDKDGLTVLPNIIQKNSLKTLKRELINAVLVDEESSAEVFDAGMVHNCMFRGQEMANMLDCDEMTQIVSALLADTFIVYAYQSSSLMPSAGGTNYGSRVHVDSPRFIDNYATNIGVIFALDDFTIENGATYFLKGSHKVESLTSENEFYSKASRATCKAGDMIVFHGRLHHAAGKNVSNSGRHALTINFCRSYMRQRFDYPRMLKDYDAIKYTDNMKKRLGWDVRVPTSLNEFYLPEDERLYKPNQG